MIRRWPTPRYVSEPRAAVGPARLRGFAVRVRRKRPRACAICGGGRDLQVAHLIAVSEARALALREKNAVILCRRCHLAFDSLTGVIPAGSRLYLEPAAIVGRHRAALDAVAASRALLRIAYAPR